MQQFIVLGQIPGTNIQIGFVVVAIVGFAFIAVVLKKYIERNRELKALVGNITKRRNLPARAYHTRTPLF